jgi:GntR family transcriptional regulator
MTQPLDITVDLKAPTPPYEQIRSQIAAYVRGGMLAHGARLPTMRALAADLGVAVGTVGRAYAELESAGLVASRRRTGTVVTGPTTPPPALPGPVQEAVAQLADVAHDSGADPETVVSLVRAAMAATRH